MKSPFLLSLLFLLALGPAAAQDAGAPGAADAPGAPGASADSSAGTNQGSPAAGTALPERLGIEVPSGGVPLEELVMRADERLEGLGDSEAAAIAEQIAQLLETANRFEEASSWYQRAAGRSRGDSRAGAELSRAGVLIQLGRTEAARAAARAGRDAATSRDLRIRAIAIMAVAYAAEERLTEAQDILRGIQIAAPDGALSPETLYQIHELARRTGDATAARDARERLQSRYPDSPEALVLTGDAAGRVLLALTPAAIAQGAYRSDEAAAEDGAPADDPAPEGEGAPPVETAAEGEEAPEGESAADGAATGRDAPEAAAETAGTERDEVRNFVQVGSFRDPENAEYMRRDMESFGFGTTVATTEVRGSTYYQVLIPVAVEEGGDVQEAIQEVVVALKERGYEGFLVTR
jgi:tetratricopeptide (TPR) repeat protein